MQRMQAEEKHEQAVNEVMEEIEDQLDSDTEDQTAAFLITSNSGTGGGQAVSTNMDSMKQNNELEQFGNIQQHNYQQ